MLRPILLLLTLVLVLPADAAADDSLVRGAFGHGTVVASSSRTPAPVCTTPAANPERRRFDCPAIGAAGFGTCTTLGRDQLCDISVSAQAPAGWAFIRWSPESTRCAGATNPVCTFRTREIDCDDTGERCTTNEPGPFVMVAEFENRRGPTITLSAGPPAGGVVFDDSRQQTFVFGTDEDEEAPTFRCRRDREPFAACTGPHVWSGIPDGEHLLCIAATDASGTAGNVAECRSWRQETEPTAAILAAPPTSTSGTDAGFTYTSNKVDHPPDGSMLSFECKLDSGAFAACPADGIRFGGLGDGTHAFSVRALFRTAGITRASVEAQHRWSVDTTPPEPTISLGPLDGPAIVDLAPTLRDADGDGFPQALDCNDRDARIRPGTLELPGNSVDENCDSVRAPFPRVAAVISTSGTWNAKATTFARLRVTGVPAGGKVHVRCSGPRRTCPFARRSLRVTKGTANGLTPRGRRLTFGVGARLEVRVTAAGMIGRVRRMRIVKTEFAPSQDLCLSPTGTAPRPCRP